MCWLDIKYSHKLIATADKIVYKLVLNADVNYCISLIRLFPYFTGQVKEPVKLVIHSTNWRLLAIFEGYHSYTDISNIYIDALGFNFFSKDFKHTIDYQHLPEIMYLAKFIIPKGNEYYVNKCGEVVSSSIKYTGEYQLIYSNPLSFNNSRKYDKIKSRQFRLVNSCFRFLDTRFGTSSIS